MLGQDIDKRRTGTSALTGKTPSIDVDSKDIGRIRTDSRRRVCFHQCLESPLACSSTLLTSEGARPTHVTGREVRDGDQHSESSDSVLCRSAHPPQRACTGANPRWGR